MSVFTPVWAVGKWQQDVCCELNGGGWGGGCNAVWVGVCECETFECF